MGLRQISSNTRQVMDRFTGAVSEIAKYQRLVDEGHDYGQQLYEAQTETANALFELLGYDV